MKAMGLFSKSPEERYAQGMKALEEGYRGRALEILEKAAGKGHKMAQYQCGRIYLSMGEEEAGNTGKAFYDRAYGWYEKAAEQGLAEAQYQCGLFHAKGLGLYRKKDRMLSFSWYRKAAEQGMAEAQYQCGLFLEQESARSDRERAYGWYEKAAEQGHIKAQMRCAELCCAGEYVRKDKAKGFEWYRRAAEQGLAEAQLMMGQLYFKGEKPLARDLDQALYWAKKAAEGKADHAEELCRGIQSAKATAKGTPKDLFRAGLAMYRAESYEEALALLEKAAQKDHTEAQYYCGLVYETRQKAKTDAVSALKWYEKAAGQGHAQAQYRCASLYYHGAKGLRVDMEKAAFWAEKALKSGAKDEEKIFGSILIAQDYELGMEAYKAKDYEKALPHLEAAVNEYWQARSLTALMYLEGKGTKADRKRALELYELEARYSSIPAEEQKEVKETENAGHALVKLGNLFYRAGRYDLAFPILKDAARSGYVSAFLRLAALYKKGSEEDGVVQDAAQAAFWFRRWLENRKPGDTVLFGAFPQEKRNMDYSGNWKDRERFDPVRWQVLEVRPDRALLLAVDGLEFSASGKVYFLDPVFSDMDRALVEEGPCHLKREQFQRCIEEQKLASPRTSATLYARVQEAKMDDLEFRMEGKWLNVRTEFESEEKKKLDASFGEAGKQGKAKLVTANYSDWWLEDGIVYDLKGAADRPKFCAGAVVRPAVWLGLGVDGQG